jgi:hypothetical protein
LFHHANKIDDPTDKIDFFTYEAEKCGGVKGEDEN